MLNPRGIKARPYDLEAMLAHQPSLVELHCSLGDLDWTPPRAFDVPLAVHVPEYAHGELLDPASPDESVRLRAQAVLTRAAGRAAAWAPFFRGRPKIVFHPGGQTSDEFNPDGNHEALRYRLREALAKTVAAMTAEVGADAEVLIENLPEICWFNSGSWHARFMTSGRELALFCEQEHIGATLDLCHLHLTRHNALEEIAAARPHVRHVHYSDARMFENGAKVSQEGLNIGEGDLPLGQYFEALGPMPEGTHAVPEVWYGHENAGAGFVKAWKDLANVRKALGAIS